MREVICATKVNVALGLKLENIEDGVVRKFYANENNTLLDRSQFGAPGVDVAKPKGVSNKTKVNNSDSSK